jgi:hypothetical protein
LELNKIDSYRLYQRGEIPAEIRPIANSILVFTTENTITVEFFIGRGFPVKHSGYLYRRNDFINAESFFRQRWPKLKKLKAHWYAF